MAADQLATIVTARIMRTSITLDILRVFHPETQICVDVHHAAIHLRDLARAIDHDLVNGVTVRQSHLVAAGSPVRRLHQARPEVLWNKWCCHAQAE